MPLAIGRSTKAGASAPATLDIIGRLLIIPLRSTKAGASAPATLGVPSSPLPRGGTLNEGLGISPGDTGLHCSNAITKASLNEGRGISPGDTRRHAHDQRRKLRRSTKAGASAPATRGLQCSSAITNHSLNEGRGISPGDTAKFCKRAVPRRNSALPRMWEPRWRRVCGHFTQLLTILRQNDQRKAVETALTTACHTRFSESLRVRR